MVVSGATSKARWVPRSVSRKRETGASPPSRCAFSGRGDGEAAAIAGQAAATSEGGEGGGREGSGANSESLCCVLGLTKAYFLGHLFEFYRNLQN